MYRKAIQNTEDEDNNCILNVYLLVWYIFVTKWFANALKVDTNWMYHYKYKLVQSL